MTLDDYNLFCAGLPHAAHVVQWGGSHVWKIAGKVFAIGSTGTDDALQVTFKCSPMSFDLLNDQPGMRPAPYLASRGMIWLQRTGPETLDDEALRSYLRESYRLVASGLSQQKRAALGISAK